MIFFYLSGVVVTFIILCVVYVIDKFNDDSALDFLITIGFLGIAALIWPVTWCFTAFYRVPMNDWDDYDD